MIKITEDAEMRARIRQAALRRVGENGKKGERRVTYRRLSASQECGRGQGRGRGGGRGMHRGGGMSVVCSLVRRRVLRSK